MSIVNETDMNRSDLKDVMFNKICEIILEEESLG
jgi:hypothetical protein